MAGIRLGFERETGITRIGMFADKYGTEVSAEVLKDIENGFTVKQVAERRSVTEEDIRDFILRNIDVIVFKK